MKNRKLTSTSDYSFGAGMNDYISGDEAIGQAVKTKILLFYGEWWEDISIGIPMFQSFIGQINSQTLKASLSDMLEKRILEVEGVQSVKNIDIEMDNQTRTMSVDVDILTANNTVTSVEVVL